MFLGFDHVEDIQRLPCLELFNSFDFYLKFEDHVLYNLSWCQQQVIKIVGKLFKELVLYYK